MDSPYYWEYDVMIGAYTVRSPWAKHINAFRSEGHANALAAMLNSAYQAGQQSKMQERLSEDVYA
jgi:hypothetical protein